MHIGLVCPCADFVDSYPGFRSLSNRLKYWKHYLRWGKADVKERLKNMIGADLVDRLKGRTPKK